MRTRSREGRREGEKEGVEGWKERGGRGEKGRERGVQTF